MKPVCGITELYIRRYIDCLYGTELNEITVMMSKYGVRFPVRVAVVRWSKRITTIVRACMSILGKENGIAFNPV
jgi:hypothetical protein